MGDGRHHPLRPLYKQRLSRIEKHQGGNVWNDAELVAGGLWGGLTFQRHWLHRVWNEIVSGFEAYKDNGTIQFLSNKGTLPLYQKQNLSVSTSVSNAPTLYLPYELSPAKAPIVAIKPPVSSTGMVKAWDWLWNDTEAAAAGNRGGAALRFPAANNTAGSAYQAYIFSLNRNLNNSTFGFQSFDEAGQLVYDMQDRPFVVVDQFECAWEPTNTSWTENHTYDSSRSYAIIQTNVNTSTYYTYSHRVYDEELSQYIYYYNGAGWVQGYRPITGGFQFFNLPGTAIGGGTDENYSEIPNYWGDIRDNKQRHMIIDVTNY